MEKDGRRFGARAARLRGLKHASRPHGETAFILSLALSYHSTMDLDTALTRLRANPDAPLDVAEVALCLARDEYPDLDAAGYLSEIDAMAHEVKQALRGGLESRLAGLCRYLFHDLGFHGNAENYFDPRNSYLNEVIDRRTGLPIALAALTMAEPAWTSPASAFRATLSLVRSPANGRWCSIPSTAAGS